MAKNSFSDEYLLFCEYMVCNLFLVGWSERELREWSWFSTNKNHMDNIHRHFQLGLLDMPFIHSSYSVFLPQLNGLVYWQSWSGHHKFVVKLCTSWLHALILWHSFRWLQKMHCEKRFGRFKWRLDSHNIIPAIHLVNLGLWNAQRLLLSFSFDLTLDSHKNISTRYVICHM